MDFISAEDAFPYIYSRFLTISLCDIDIKPIHWCAADKGRVVMSVLNPYKRLKACYAYRILLLGLYLS